MFERYSDSSASFILLDSSNTSVYKQLFRAAKAKGKLRLRVSIFDKTTSKPEAVQTTPNLPDRLTSRKYIHPFNSELYNTELTPSARLSTLVDLKTASEAPSTTTLTPSNKDQAEDQASAKMAQPRPYFWPITDNSGWSDSTKSAFQKDPKHETQEALRIVHDAIASRNASKLSTAHKSTEGEAPVPRYFSAREHCRAEMSGLLNGSIPPQCSFAKGPNPCANFTICCNNCDGAIPDAHWHCSMCDEGDFDLCQDCVDRGYSCDDDEHWLIKRSVEDGKVVNSKTEIIAPKKAIKVEQSEEEKEIPGAFTSHAQTENVSAASDLSRTCNQCVQGETFYIQS